MGAWARRRIFVIEWGQMVTIRDADLNEVTFESLEDFSRCTGQDWSSKFELNYEPEVNIFSDSEDPNVGPELIPYQPYEDLIDMVPTLIERLADPYYGVTDAGQIQVITSEQAELHQQLSVGMIYSHNQREGMGLPPLLSDEQLHAHEDYIHQMQGLIDNPPMEPVDIPEPPDIEPPNYESATIEIDRTVVQGGAIGFRGILRSVAQSMQPGQFYLVIYDEEDCSGYVYQTANFAWDPIEGYWFADCPQGQEPGNIDLHFGCQYGAGINLGCFSMDSSRTTQTFTVFRMI